MNSPPEADPTRPGPLSAQDRVQAPSAPDPDEPRQWWRPLALVALLVVGVVIAWILVRGDVTPETSTNILVHLVDAATQFQPDVATTRPEEAEAYILESLGWSVPPPDLPGLALVGVGIAPIGTAPGGATGAEVSDVVTPAYRFEGGQGETAYVFAYDYIVLDQVRSEFDLPEATYSVLAEPTPVDTRRLDDAYLVTWRRRAIIFTAVTRNEALFERIAQAVAA